MDKAIRPAFGRAPHLVDPASGLAVWFTQPLGLVTQLHERTHLDEAMARFIADTAYGALCRLRAPGQLFVAVHEWSAMTGYDSAARAVLTDWGVRIRNEVERVVIVLSDAAPKLVRMGVSVASVTLRLAGMRIDAERSPSVIARLGLRALPALTPA